MNSWEVYRINSADERDYPISGIPTTNDVTIAEAYWMLKASLDDSDANAVASITITQEQQDQGYISTDGLNDGTALLKFLIAETLLSACDPKVTYFRSLKVKLSNDRYSAPQDADAPVRILPAGVQKGSGGTTPSAGSFIVTQGFGLRDLITQGYS